MSATEPIFTEGEIRPSRYPVPDGYMTPAEFCHLLRAKNIANILPQYIYGWINKPGSGFPYTFVKTVALQEDGEDTDDTRRIIPVDEGINWIVSYLQSRAEKEARKAAEAARKAEAAAVAAGQIITSDIEPEDEWREWAGDFK